MGKKVIDINGLLKQRAAASDDVESSTRLCYVCVGCGSYDFLLMQDGSVECSNCGASIYDKLWFDPSEKV